MGDAEEVQRMKAIHSKTINDRLGLAGEFSQLDQFAPLIRGSEQFDHIRRCIAEYPLQAKL